MTRISHQIESIFNEYSKIYSQIGSYIPKFIITQNLEIIELVKNAESQNNVLNVACGTGILLEMLGDEYTRFGIDLSPGMIVVAQKTTSDISYTVGDTHTLPLEPSSMDVLICKNSFYFLDPKGALKSFAYVLKPKGILILTSYNENPNIKRLFATAFYDALIGSVIDLATERIPFKFVKEAWSSTFSQIKFQKQVAEHTKEPIPLQKLTDLLSLHFTNIQIIDDDHYCDTQYLIQAQRGE